MVPARPGPPRFTSFRLANGLTVVLAPRAESPTASVWVWYQVGSKNEWPGVTGASHWVEHMLFEGSPRYAKGEIDRAVVSVGGQLNAFTDADFTAYFSTVPREHLAVPLDIESDRMTRALITDEEVERERTIIFSEREGDENWPEFRVDEEMWQLAFRVHPYRWPVLGYVRDIRDLSGQGLRDYYHRFYGPRNATLLVSGGFEPTSIAREIRRRFGKLPATGDDPGLRIEEPAARGERRSELGGPGTTPYLEIGWRAPSIADPQAPATLFLDALLSGETRLFPIGSGWGRGGEHPSARLYRALVDPGLAVHATSEWAPRVAPGLFTVQVQAAPGVTLDRIEAAVDDAIERLVRSGPTRTEMQEVRTRLRHGRAMAYEGATRTGFRLGYFTALGGRQLEPRLYRSLMQLRASEVRARAQDLFRPQSRVVVRFTPTQESGHE